MTEIKHILLVDVYWAFIIMPESCALNALSHLILQFYEATIIDEKSEILRHKFTWPRYTTIYLSDRVKVCAESVDSNPCSLPHNIRTNKKLGKKYLKIGKD